MNTITNLNTFPIGNSLDGVNIITEEINTLSLLVDGTNNMLADLNIGNHSIKNMEAGVDGLDAVNKSQLDLKSDTSYVNNNFVDKANTQTITGAKQFNNTIGLNALDLTPTFTEGANVKFDSSTLKLKSKSLNGIGFKAWSPTMSEPATDTFTIGNGGYFGTTLTDGGMFLNGESEIWLNVGSNDLYSKIFQETTNNKLVFISHEKNSGGVMSFYSGKLVGGNDTFTEIFNINNTSMNVFKELNVNNNKIISLSNGTNANDAVNFSQLSALRTYTDASLNLKVNKSGDTMTGNFLLSGSNQFILNSSADTGQGKHENYFAGDWYQVCRASTGTKGLIIRVSNNVAPTSSHDRLKITGDGSISLLGATTISNTLSMNTTNKIINLADPTTAQDASTKNYTDNQDNLKVNKAGDTMTGDLNISLAGTSTTTNKQLNLQTNNNGLWVNPYLSTGAYNPLIQNGSKGIIFSNGTVNTGELFIAPWSNFNYGLQISSNGETTIHGKLLRNAWSSGELIQTKIYNQNTSGSGVLQINSNSGAIIWKSVNFTMLNSVSDSDLVVEVSAPYYISGSGQDTILSQIRDYTNSVEQEVLITSQFWTGAGGGGTRSGILLPLLASYTPSSNTSTKTRNIQIRFNNASTDTLYICKTVFPGTIADTDYYTIKISEYKK